MNVLIIYAHPNPNSFNHAILEQVERGLRASSHSFTTLDLYGDGFNPVLVFNDKKRKSDLADDPETERYRQLITAADHLIFIYPIWWYGTPAILKGFLDRVLVSGFAYTNDGKRPRGLLKNKSAWIVYTIDSPSWFVRVFRRSVEWTVMRNAVLKYCGIKPVKRLMFASAGRSSNDDRQKWLNSIYRFAAAGLR